MSASVTQLQESPLDPKLLVPPPGAIERRECPDKKPPEVLDQPTPNYDPRNHGKTETDAQVTVLTDGTIGNVQIVGSADRAHDNLVMEALKKWKFKPAMCGADPVVADIYVSLVFETPFIR
jgi:TonB family protein